MAIYFFKVNIIGRSSGRSATGAASYRSGDVLRSAAYRSGGELHTGDIVHDYTNKGGIVHSEIILPEDAPPEYADRQTLWNAVDEIERRHDSQLAREIIVALQREFELQEQIDILRDYIQESFVSSGMIADFAVHDKGDGNPHAHIMLTMRDVTPKGFGKKNRDWNRPEKLMIWRKNWADANNRMFKHKGMDERIDHRSYEEQGIDREPQIHMGHEAWALEKKGVRTEKGDYNRAVKQRNEEREAREAAQDGGEPQSGSSDSNKDNMSGKKPLDSDKKQDEPKTAKPLEPYIKAEKTKHIIDRMKQERKNATWKNRQRHISELKQQRPRQQEHGSDFEKRFTAEKAMQHIEKPKQKRPIDGQGPPEKIAQHRHALKGALFALAKEDNEIAWQLDKTTHEVYRLTFREEVIDRHIRDTALAQEKIDEMQQSRQNLHLWDFAQKKRLDEEIKDAEQKAVREQDDFKKLYNIDPAAAGAELKRLLEIKRAKERDMVLKRIRRQKIIEQQEAIKLEYHTQKLLSDIRPDRDQIEKSLEKLNTPPETVRDKLLQEQIDHMLNTIADENFQKVIDNLPEEQAKILVKHREQTIERDLAKAMEQKRNQSHERSR